MIERLVDPNASNWVDRGQEPDTELQRVLEFHLGREAMIEPSRLREHVLAIRGMIEADATEFQVSGYLVLIEREAQVPPSPPEVRRTVAIALWHMGKAAEVRDRARRLIEFGIRPAPAPEQPPTAT